jgi:hypothetical protein
MTRFADGRRWRFSLEMLVRNTENGWSTILSWEALNRQFYRRVCLSVVGYNHLSGVCCGPLSRDFCRECTHRIIHDLIFSGVLLPDFKFCAAVFRPAFDSVIGV